MQSKTKKNFNIYIKYLILFFSIAILISTILSANIWIRMRVKPAVIVWLSILLLTILKIIFNIKVDFKYFYLIEILIITFGVMLKRLPTVIYDIRDSLFINLPISKFSSILIILLAFTNVYMFSKK